MNGLEDEGDLGVGILVQYFSSDVPTYSLIVGQNNGYVVIEYNNNVYNIGLYLITIYVLFFFQILIYNV